MTKNSDCLTLYLKNCTSYKSRQIAYVRTLQTQNLFFNKYAQEQTFSIS